MLVASPATWISLPGSSFTLGAIILAPNQKLDCHNDCITCTLQVGYKRPHMSGYGNTYLGIPGVQGHVWLSSEIMSQTLEQNNRKQNNTPPHTHIPSKL